MKLKIQKKAARLVQLQELEAKWLKPSDQKKVAAGKKPKGKPAKIGVLGRVRLIQGGKVSPR